MLGVVVVVVMMLSARLRLLLDDVERWARWWASRASRVLNEVGCLGGEDVGCGSHEVQPKVSCWQRGAGGRAKVVAVVGREQELEWMVGRQECQ